MVRKHYDLRSRGRFNRRWESCSYSLIRIICIQFRFYKGTKYLKLLGMSPVLIRGLLVTQDEAWGYLGILALSWVSEEQVALLMTWSHLG